MTGETKSNLWMWTHRSKTILAWIALSAFLSMFIAHQHLIHTYPYLAVSMPKSRGEQLTLMWRNYSLLVIVASSLPSLPRWPSLVAIIGTILFLILYGGQ